jgi:hypothetical protein
MSDFCLTVFAMQWGGKHAIMQAAVLLLYHAIPNQDMACFAFHCVLQTASGVQLFFNTGDV